VVMSSLAESPNLNQYAISYQRPTRRTLPQVLVVPLREHAQASEWREFLSLAGPLRAIIESKHWLNPELVSQLTEHSESLVELLGLIAMETPAGRCVLSDEAQAAMAALLATQPSLLDERFTCLQTFCREIAPGLSGFSEATQECFHRILIADET